VDRNRKTRKIVLNIVPLADARKERAVHISALSELARWLIKSFPGVGTGNGVTDLEKRLQ